MLLAWRSGVPEDGLDPPRRNPSVLNEPASSFATLSHLHGPLRRVPDRWLGDVDRPLNEEKATGQNGDRTVLSRRRLAEVSRCVFQGITPVSDGEKKDPWRFDPRGDAPSAHRRPGYSLSGCTPAEPDSASPGTGSIAEFRERAQGWRKAKGSA